MEHMNSKQSKDPSITFIIPALNEEKLIAFAIRSIRAEMAGRPNEYEILIVDNASTDRTAEVALEQGAHVVHELRRASSQPDKPDIGTPNMNCSPISMPITRFQQVGWTEPLRRWIPLRSW